MSPASAQRSRKPSGGNNYNGSKYDGNKYGGGKYGGGKYDGNKYGGGKYGGGKYDGNKYGGGKYGGGKYDGNKYGGKYGGNKYGGKYGPEWKHIPQSAKNQYKIDRALREGKITTGEAVGASVLNGLLRASEQQNHSPHHRHPHHH